MIAIKQAKFKPSNKIQENQIKNITTRPSNVAQINTTTTTTTSQPQKQNHLQHQSHNNQVISSKIDTHPCQAQSAQEPQLDEPAALGDNNLKQQHHHHHHHHQPHHNHQYHLNRHQQQSNETRSETGEKIDGATTRSATPTNSSPSAPMLAARPQPSSSSQSSTATTSSLSPAAAAAPSAWPPSGALMANRQASQQQQLQQQQQQQHLRLATSLANASAKIQQRQQKFLAAAAGQQSQQTACNRQTLLLTTPSEGDALHGGARPKVSSMATMMSGSNVLLDRNSASSKARVVNMPPQADIDKHHSTGCASLDAPAVFDSCGTTFAVATTTTGAASNTAAVTVSDIDDANRGPMCCSFKCDANNLAGAYQQQVVPPQNEREVRQSGENNKANDDNINIKNSNTRHNNHYHYHHYYNPNYLNFHRLQAQQQQPQQPQHQHQNYFHLQQYQQAINSPNQTTPQQQQPVMAHYKFHNDCQSSVLTYEQVKRLDFVMDQTVPIHGRGNSPTLFVKLKELIRLVKHKLQNEHSIEIRDVRLNGGAASYVLAPENSKYNDLDLVFGTDLSNEDRFDVIRDVVLDCLMEFYPDKSQAQPGDQSTSSGYENPLGVNCNIRDGTRELANNTSPTDDEDDDDSCGPQSRSHRSSSFESDNLNVTTNELDDDGSDEEDDVIVRIDSEDTGCEFDAKIGKEQDCVEEQSKTLDETEDASNSGGRKACDGSLIRSSDGGHVAVNDNASAADYVKSTNKQAENPYLGYQYQSYNQMPPNNCAFKEAYVHKMVKVNDDDRWSLISLGVQQSETSGAHQLQQAILNGNQQAASSALAATDNQQQQSQTRTSPVWCDNFGSQQKQSPNSIELKFVDRMRRKFEFSVDSFQIILDSLIQFYDYAPQSTITIQRTTPGVQSTRPMILNASPLMSIGRCLQCDREQEARVVREQAVTETAERSSVGSNTQNTKGKSVGKKFAERTHCETLTDSRSFYELPLEPGNSLSNSSVASSSGCSSSSSVVSSSSSSLSCDEDQEDLYCDVDNSPSSSASTSSLLSSTTTSGAGSPCDTLREPKSQQFKQSAPTCKQQSHQGYQRRVIGEPGCDRLTAPCVGLNDLGGCRDLLQHNQVHQMQSSVSNYKQHHVHTRSFNGNLGDQRTSRISSCAVISENFYPTVIGRSEYGNFKEALYHLEKKLIATRSPEEIRGGGLLKYCNLLVKNYKPTNVYQIRTLERYMCSRFFIDFSDLNQQRAKLESYLANHFSDDAKQKFDYLTILHNVVQRSTVCLMNHELRLTLNMIRSLAYNLPQQVQSQSQLEPLPQSHQQINHSQSQQNQQLFTSLQQDQASHFSQQSPDKQGHSYQQQQQQPATVQSGVYRVKMVNYALAQPNEMRGHGAVPSGPEKKLLAKTDKEKNRAGGKT